MDSTTISNLAQDLIDAITAETLAFRAAPADGSAEDITDAAVGRVIAIERQLRSVPVDTVHQEIDRNGDMDYVHAMALAHRRWLVMSNGYRDKGNVTECRLVDALLHGTPFDKVPMLWHIDGNPCDARPSEADLRAGWEADR